MGMVLIDQGYYRIPISMTVESNDTGFATVFAVIELMDFSFHLATPVTLPNTLLRPYPIPDHSLKHRLETRKNHRQKVPHAFAALITFPSVIKTY